MAVESKHKMSQERFDELKAELTFLETVREKEVSEQIKEARSFGDLSENSEYDEAKTEQGKLYSKMAELRVLLENAEIIEKADIAHDAVTMGGTVRVMDLTEKEECVFQIVGSQEVNPVLGRVSDESPIGRALMGSRVGDTVCVEAPAGELHFSVIAIEN